MNNIENILKIAIENKNMIIFSYNGFKRRAEPYHYGILNEILQLHSYQVSNGSKSKHLPSWKNFKLKNIKHLLIEDDSRFEERSDYHPENANYSLIIKSVRD